LSGQHTATRFTNSRKWFWCKVMFENEHTLCLWFAPCLHLHSFCETVKSSGLATGWPWLEYQGRGWQNITQLWMHFWFHFCTAVCACYWAVF
jgi:hypothetical protein